MSANRADAADRILTLSGKLTRWWAKDFKPGRIPLGITSTQFSILAMGEEVPGINMSQIAERLDLSVPTVVRAVHALERKGLVDRRRASATQRDVTVAVTREGHDCRAAVERLRHERLSGLLARMTDAEVDALLLGFTGMAHAADRSER